MTPGDEHEADQDVIRDALGLIEAVHRRDFEALGVLAANANLRLVCVQLARICSDLVGDLAALHDTADEDLLGRLRDEWTVT